MYCSQILPNLPQTTVLEILHILRSALPAPVTDTPEAIATRDDLAIGALIDLHPADRFEAKLASQIVAADAHAMDCLRVVGLPNQDPTEARRCRAQAATMFRLAQSGLRALQHIQTTREKAEAAMQPAAMERAGWWFRDASVPLPDEPPEDAAEPVVDLAAEAERYAVIYPDRAARIRAAGGLQERVEFGPPDDALVAAIVSGTSPALLEVDKRPERQLAGRPARNVSGGGAMSQCVGSETELRRRGIGG
jgi:hypothetical protein